MVESAELLGAFRAIVGPDGVLAEGDDRSRYEQGWRYGGGRARAVVRPRTTAEVSSLLSLCHGRGIRVIPQGANSGLVGASTPDGSGEEVVLSLERLRAPLEIDPVDRVAIVGGGMLLGELNAALLPHGLFFPIDLGADPSIGGMVATNTGGCRLLRYGDVARRLLGVELVLADGTVVDALRPLRKNNVGLSLARIAAGTFGCFGVVTAAALELAPLPRQRATAWVAAQSGEQALELLVALERRTGETLTAFEAISRNAFAPVLAHQPALRNPFEGMPIPAYALLVELSTGLPASTLDLPRFLEETLGELLGEGTEAFVAPPEEAWGIRHSVSESLRLEGKVVAFDLSVRRSLLPELTRRIGALALARFPFVRCCDYGHWGDGGTHVNLIWREGESPLPESELRAILQREVYDLCVRELGGSWSAEHGVGPHNQEFHRLYTPAPLREMARVLADLCDPKRILGRTRLD